MEGWVEPPSSVLVGREPEMGALLAGLEDALSGRGRLFLLSGEPGIGKTRLADEVAGRARERGARVLWGRCWEEGGAPPYWPWVQVLRSLLRRRGPEDVAAALGPDVVDVAQLLPEVGRVEAEGPVPPPSDPEGARFRLFDAATSFLIRQAEERALVLVLEDLHAADAPSLLLLRFTAGEIGEAPILLVGTLRDVELGHEHPLTEALAELARQPISRRLELRGLAEPDVARFIEATTGTPPPPSVVSMVHAQTEGNPLFVGEVVRLLASEGRLEHPVDAAAWSLSVPRGVRDVIGRRLSRLSKESGRALSLASVLGREFELETLERLSGLSTEELGEVLDEAAAARLVAETPGAPGRLRFTHVLIRDTLYDELTPVHRARLHRRAGEIIEDLHRSHIDARLPELAHHFGRAGPATEVAGRAVDYARRAAEAALRSLAYEEAVRLFRMALEGLEASEGDPAAARCELLLALADAQARAGDLPGAKESYLRAADVARRLGLREHLARAAVGYGGRFVWPRAGSDARMLPLLYEALDALGDGDLDLRVRLLARLAGALRDDPSTEERDRLSREAVALARRLGDPRTLAYALSGRYAAMLGPDRQAAGGEIAADLLEVAERAGDPEILFEGHLHRMIFLVREGRLSEAHREAQAMAAIATSLRQPAQLWLSRAIDAMFALLEGRFAEAEEAIEAAVLLGRRAQNWDAEVFSRIQLYGLRREQGRLHDVERTIEAAIEEYPTRPLFRCLLAGVRVERGDSEAARVIVDELGAGGFRSLPVNNDWLLSTDVLAQVIAQLRHRPGAEGLYGLLLPYADLVVDTAEMSTGSVSRPLGLLAATLGRWDEAEGHFRRAVEVNERIGARPWAAHARHDHARMLLARDGPGDRERALELLATCLRTCRELGMVALEGRCA
ncbi:MAG TPA: AAA family ATPase, partial [Actinomycetota bacterium]|nr:AAA family ATPase [Actinomycetota bacterium]